jgi:hypothetical protein
VWIVANILWLRAVLIYNAECLDTALSMIYCPYTTNPGVPYCYYKLVTIVIKAVKIKVLSNLWYFFEPFI